MEQCPEIDLQSLDVLTLASNYKMFMQYAPKIFRKIHRTMDNPASADGVSFGQLFEVLTSKNHKASYWILDHTDIQAGWPEVNDGRTLLMDICEAGNLEVARYLIEEKYADISARTGQREMNLSLFGQTASSSPATSKATSTRCLRMARPSSSRRCGTATWRSTP